ncbi:NADH dehydrogenase [ubiquinone] flavoprotein 1, mitochondrial, partial [Coemansia sp. Benny D160-2]
MSNITRSAKSAGDWSECELMAYNIIVHDQSSVEFFGFEPSSSLDYLDSHIIFGPLNTRFDSLSDQSYRLLEYLSLAMKPSHIQESMIDAFTKELLRVIGFEERGT